MVIDQSVQQVIGAAVSTLLGVILLFLIRLISQVTPVVVTWLVKQKNYVESKMTNEQLAAFNLIVTSAVQTAEQNGLIGRIENTATSKKDFALHIIQDQLNKLNIPFDVADADRQIEAAINQGLQNSPVQNILVQGTALKLDPVNTPAPVAPAVVPNA